MPPKPNSVVVDHNTVFPSSRPVICPLQSGPKVNLDWTLKETKNGQEARA